MHWFNVTTMPLYMKTLGTVDFAVLERVVLKPVLPNTVITVFVFPEYILVFSPGQFCVGCRSMQCLASFLSKYREMCIWKVAGSIVSVWISAWGKNPLNVLLSVSVILRTSFLTCFLCLSVSAQNFLPFIQLLQWAENCFTLKEGVKRDMLYTQRRVERHVQALLWEMTSSKGRQKQEHWAHPWPCHVPRWASAAQ